MNEADAEAYKALHHEDYSFKFYSTGCLMICADVNNLDMKNMMMPHKNTDQRYVHEHGGILVKHALPESPSGDK